MDSVTLQAGTARAVIALRGAQALQWRAGGRELLWQPDRALWSDVSPLLFPVVGWTRRGQARVAEQRLPYVLAIHPLEHHPLVRFAVSGDPELLGECQAAQTCLHVQWDGLVPLVVRLLVGRLG